MILGWHVNRALLRKPSPKVWLGRALRLRWLPDPSPDVQNRATRLSQLWLPWGPEADRRADAPLETARLPAARLPPPDNN